LALIEKMSIPIDTVPSICLLTGILADTQCFRTPNTTTYSMGTAIRLIDRGAPLSWIVDCLFRTHPVAKLALWGSALSSIQSSGDIVWANVTQDAFVRSGASPDQTDGLIDMLAGVREAKVVALFKELPGDNIKVSLRSSGQPDVAEVATHFGGGGHRGASGFSIDSSIEQAQELVLSFIGRQLRSSQPAQEVE
jgi:phosphoesterase RecJ-like protein